MADRWSKKTEPEREDEEAERLVRESPKLKPPRRDRRRERMDTSEEEEQDKDLSLNRKNVGGSVQRVITLWAARKNIPVVNRETGKPVPGGVSPKTLKENPGKYEKIEAEPDKESPKTPEAPEPSPKEDSQPKPEPEPDPAETHAALQELAKSNPNVAKGFGYLMNTSRPGIGQDVKYNPHLPLTFGGYFKDVKMPPGIKTLGDLQKALQFEPPKPEEPKPEEPKPEEPKPEPAPAPKPEESKPEEPRFEDPSQEPDKPTEQPPEEAQPPKKDEAPAEGQPAEEEAKPAEEGPKKPAEKKPKKPAEKKPKKPAKGKPSKKEPEPETIAEAHGISKPSRPEPTPAEKNKMEVDLALTFPPEIADRFIAMNLHPHDARNLINEYLLAKNEPVKDPQKFAESISKVYTTDMDEVEPPKTWEKDGQEVPFDDLSPKEKADAYVKHQTQIVAMSLAAREQIAASLQTHSATGRGEFPEEMLSLVAGAMLSPKGDTRGMAQTAFDTMIESGQAHDIPPKSAQKLLGKLDLATKEIAQAFFMGNDYQVAKERFGSKLSEWDNPSKIASTLKKANDFFEKRARLYGVRKTPMAAPLFRKRILDRLLVLNPDKYPDVQAIVDKMDVQEYERDYKLWQKEHAEWLDKVTTYRDKPSDEPEPQEPLRPARLASPEESKAKRDKALERATVAPSDKGAEPGKTARVVARFVDSIYSRGSAMEHQSDKTAVYHGVDPYEQDPGPYPEWQPAHQRDIGETDYGIILANAKKWLQTPMLSRNIDGMLPDARFRAALDLAIQASPYNRAIDPSRYNMLLGRLSGEETLNREAKSTCASPPCEVHASDQRETDTMTTKLSAEQKKMASSVLTKLDETAREIQAGYNQWGLPMEEAKKMVNALDRMADNFEINAFGRESWERRRREVMGAVHQRDSDEPYMDTFRNPHQPVQTDADEPFMNAYNDDQSSAVETGREENGEALAP